MKAIQKKPDSFDPGCGVIFSSWLAKLVNALAAGKVTFSGRTAGPWKKCSSACWAGNPTAAARVTSAFTSRLSRNLPNRWLQLRGSLGTNPHVNSQNGSSDTERANRAILLSRTSSPSSAFPKLAASATPMSEVSWPQIALETDPFRPSLPFEIPPRLARGPSPSRSRRLYRIPLLIVSKAWHRFLHRI
jgi:hypothetical protein